MNFYHVFFIELWFVNIFDTFQWKTSAHDCQCGSFKLPRITNTAFQFHWPEEYKTSWHRLLILRELVAENFLFHTRKRISTILIIQFFFSLNRTDALITKSEFLYHVHLLKRTQTYILGQLSDNNSKFILGIFVYLILATDLAGCITQKLATLLRSAHGMESDMSNRWFSFDILHTVWIISKQNSQWQYRQRHCYST